MPSEFRRKFLPQIFFEQLYKHNCIRIFRIIQEMPGQIEHIIPSSDSKTAYVIVDGKVYTYNDRDGLKKSDQTIANDNLTRAVAKIEFVRFDEKEVLVALTRKYVLYVDGKQVANNVTSFSVHSDFLLMTTSQHSLLCFKLNAVGLRQLCTKDLTVQPWNNENSDIHRTQGITLSIFVSTV